MPHRHPERRRERRQLDAHRVRLAYTWDRARHRQTGQTAFQLANGEPSDVFPINDPLLTSIDRIWNDRPLPPKGEVSRHPDALAGQTAEEKLATIAAVLAKEGADAVVLTTELPDTYRLLGRAPRRLLPLRPAPSAVVGSWRVDS